VFVWAGPQVQRKVEGLLPGIHAVKVKSLQAEPKPKALETGRPKSRATTLHLRPRPKKENLIQKELSATYIVLANRLPNQKTMNWPKVREEIELRTSRSSGAGGQHVNKTESRVELVFNVMESDAFTAREKRNLEHHLGRKIDASGRVSVVDQSGRSQHTNRKRALARLKEILERGRRPIPKIHKGKPFVANKRKRLDHKKRRGEVKASRGKRWL